MILNLNVALSHLETFVQSCTSCDQTTEHTPEQSCGCTDHKGTHAVARKLPVVKIWREEFLYEHQEPHDEDENDAVNGRCPDV
jgi:hypothetical protein